MTDWQQDVFVITDFFVIISTFGHNFDISHNVICHMFGYISYFQLDIIDFLGHNLNF